MTLSKDAKKISFVQINPMAAGGGNVSFVADGKECDASLGDIREEADNLLNALPGLRSLEQKEIAALKEEKQEAVAEADAERKKAMAAEEKARIAEATLKRAQNHLAELLTGEAGKEMTDDMAAMYPELQDGISIDAGDYYREVGGKVLYRAKKDMVYDHATMAPTGEHGSEYWIGSGITEEKPNTGAFKYPKGTEKEYMGTMYYACVDTNDEPSVGYPTWDLLDNKPQN
ncbi:hypothetical protein K5I04_04935 [Murdochiella sp. Marseille-P8839]|nr:hypothetical protein [Murdochiella sp. Marseille-P8839]